jgi:hypothetical protein
MIREIIQNFKIFYYRIIYNSYNYVLDVNLVNIVNNDMVIRYIFVFVVVVDMMVGVDYHNYHNGALIFVAIVIFITVFINDIRISGKVDVRDILSFLHRPLMIIRYRNLHFFYHLRTFLCRQNLVLNCFGSVAW